MKKRPLSKRQIKGIKDSINKKWIPIVLIECGDKGVNNCPLCELYYNKDYEDDENCCKYCPIKWETGLRYCYSTPYSKFITSSSLDNEFHSVVTDEPSLEYAYKETLFLINLLPESEQGDFEQRALEAKNQTLEKLRGENYGKSNDEMRA